VALQVRTGALRVRLGDGTERLFQPAGHGLRAVVLAGHGSSISGDAIAWMVREKVAILISSNSTEFISNFNVKTGADALLLFAPEPAPIHQGVPWQLGRNSTRRRWTDRRRC
jgi:hypothetical protein